MHEYSIINHDRASIGKWLGISALILAGLISEWIKQIYSFSGIEAFGKITVTVKRNPKMYQYAEVKCTTLQHYFADKFSKPASLFCFNL